MDRIQELMEELGPGATLKVLRDPPRFLAQHSDCRTTCYGHTAAAALTKLRDKVKPRTPEQVMAEALIEHWGGEGTWRECTNQVVEREVEVAAAALRDAGMLREDA